MENKKYSSENFDESRAVVPEKAAAPGGDIKEKTTSAQRKKKMRMIKYIIGALAGGIAGYFVFYRLIGCATGSCPITSSPYISILYGILIGVLFAAGL